eukprot:1673337-Pyramimonas_sp.AAC.1
MTHTALHGYGASPRAQSRVAQHSMTSPRRNTARHCTALHSISRHCKALPNMWAHARTHIESVSAHCVP